VTSSSVVVGVAAGLIWILEQKRKELADEARQRWGRTATSEEPCSPRTKLGILEQGPNGGIIDYVEI
jgi:hypothetical protein